MSGGFFRGTSADQDTRFSNKQAKLLKSQKFAPELEHLVDITKVKMDVMRPWIATRVTELLGFEDEVLLNFIYTLLEGKEVNGKEVQIALTGFMEKNTGRFMKELWMLLLSAQNTGSGIPQQFLDAKKEELEKKQADDRWIKNEIQKKEESKELHQERSKKMDDGIGTKFSNPDLELASRSLQRKGSSDDSGDDKETVKRNGSGGRNRFSQSSNSADRGSPTRSGRSFSHSRSYSGDRQKSRSVSRSPRMRRSSISPRGWSISPPARRPRISSSPSRRRPSYSRRRSRSPSSSRSPPMQHRLGSYRRRSPSPIRRRSPSPRHRRTPSPFRGRKTPSPVRHRRSPSPIHRRRSPSPIRRRRSPSPIRRRRSPSPIRRRRSPSPIRRRRSPSPIRRRRSPSPIRRRRSPSPIRRRRSPSPIRHRRSPSPIRHRRSPSPVRSHRLHSPVRRRRSPSPIQRRSPPRICRSSLSPTYHRSPSPPPRILPSADHGFSSPVRPRCRSPPHHDSLTSERGRSLSPQHRSVSPYRRRHQRSSSTPGSRSVSPMQSRSPPHRRLPTPHDSSASPCSSPSPVRHASSTLNLRSLKEKRRSPKEHRRSPAGSLGERVRTRETLFPAPHRPSSPLRSPVVDHHKDSNDLRREVPSLPLLVSPKRPKSPILVKTKSPSVDRSPYKSPMRQSGGQLARDDSTSKKSRELKPHQDSHDTSEEEDMKYIRERGVYKSRSSQNPSSHTTAVGKQKDSPVRVHIKNEKSSEGGLNRHHDQSEKSYERGVHSATFDGQRSPTLSHNILLKEKRALDKVDGQKSDEKDNRKSSNVKAEHARHGSDRMTLVVQRLDHSNGSGAILSDPDEGKKHSDKHKEKRKHRRSHRREVSSEDDESYDSEIEDRKEAKRRKKEEKKLRKEEKRRRREERRRRKEARRAEKLKLKDQNNDNSSEDDDVGKNKSHGSDNDDAQDEQKKLEIELRKKALELYQAKKRNSR